MADTTSSTLTYKRVLLKISGEAMMGGQPFGIDTQTVSTLAGEIAKARDTGVELCLVIGGGNIFRGVSGAASGMDRAQADSMGMLATVMNALAMQNALEAAGAPTRVQSGLRMDEVCEPFIRRRAIRHMEKGRIVIFAAGTGSPYFTTDTGAALRAAEMGCNAMMKGTQVDGVYSADPKTNPDATRYDRLTYSDVLSRNLRVMDATAVSLLRETDIPIIVFSLHEQDALQNVLAGIGKSTLISGG